jgi:hypothetical protein
MRHLHAQVSFAASPVRLAAGGNRVLFLVCEDCECSSDAELERRIAAQFIVPALGAAE